MFGIHSRGYMHELLRPHLLTAGPYDRERYDRHHEDHYGPPPPRGDRYGPPPPHHRGDYGYPDDDYHGPPRRCIAGEGQRRGTERNASPVSCIQLWREGGSLSLITLPGIGRLG